MLVARWAPGFPVLGPQVPGSRADFGGRRGSRVPGFIHWLGFLKSNAYMYSNSAYKAMSSYKII
eukprot:2071644-Pyramimonas_sp.AAC.1